MAALLFCAPPPFRSPCATPAIELAYAFPAPAFASIELSAPVWAPVGLLAPGTSELMPPRIPLSAGAAAAYGLVCDVCVCVLLLVPPIKVAFPKRHVRRGSLQERAPSLCARRCGRRRSLQPWRKLRCIGAKEATAPSARRRTPTKRRPCPYQSRPARWWPRRGSSCRPRPATTDRRRAACRIRYRRYG